MSHFSSTPRALIAIFALASACAGCSQMRSSMSGDSGSGAMSGSSGSSGMAGASGSGSADPGSDTSARKNNSGKTEGATPGTALPVSDGSR